MNIEVKSFKELSATEVYEMLRLRAEVFIVEQTCIYQDIDNKDQKAIHILGYERNELIAYTRIFPPGAYFDSASIGRVLVKKKHRNKKAGRAIVNASVAAISDHFNTNQIEISAQTYLIQFYSDLGFYSKGNEYLEDGIPHIRMQKNSPVQG